MLNRNAGRSSSGMRWPLISPGKNQQRPIFNSTGRPLRRREEHCKLQTANCKLGIGHTGRRSLHLLMGCFFSFSLLFLPTFLDAQTPPLKNMNFPRPIETAELVPLVNHPSVRIIDMRSSLLDYLKGHIPNAVYLHFENLRVARHGSPAQGPDRRVGKMYNREAFGDSKLSFSLSQKMLRQSHARKPGGKKMGSGPSLNKRGCDCRFPACQ